MSPDWAALRKVTEEAATLWKAGALDQAEYDRLWEAGKQACRGQTQFLEALVLLRPGRRR